MSTDMTEGKKKNSVGLEIYLDIKNIYHYKTNLPSYNFFLLQ